jgi:hypothetical protein
MTAIRPKRRRCVKSDFGKPSMAHSSHRKGQLGCPMGHQPCGHGASATSSNGVRWRSTERRILAQPCPYRRLPSGGVRRSDGFASRRSPVRSRYAPSSIEVRLRCRGGMTTSIDSRSIPADAADAGIGGGGCRVQSVTEPPRATPENARTSGHRLQPRPDRLLRIARPVRVVVADLL